MKISLAAGRVVSLVRLQQSGTYYGLLAGRPDTRGDLQYVERLKREAVALLPEVGSAVLLEPPSIAPLPAVACIGVLDSGPLARPGAEPYSSVAVLWFQDEFGAPAAYALAGIAGLDWEAVAVQWCW
ncbi:MAG: hypothetical protein AB7O31_01925 [Burkholderiales bacterium]